jgi:hypothetical protein
MQMVEIWVVSGELRVMSCEFIQTLMTSRNSVLLFKQDGQDFFLFILFVLFLLCRSGSSSRRVRELTLPHSNLRSCSAGQPCPAGGCGRWLSRTAIECELAPSRIF